MRPASTESGESLAVRARGVTHTYGEAADDGPVLRDIDLDLEPGEIVILTGPSGSGKTTLLTLIGALRRLQQGELAVLGHALAGLDDERLVAVRRRIGFIFQSHNLFASLTARQNVRLGAELHRELLPDADRLASETLAAVGLGDKLDSKPGELSGGQRQRVAVARALVASPRLVLADEPTAALDRDSGRLVVDLLQRLGREHGTTTLLVTHDHRILDVADRIVSMVDGRIASDVRVAESVRICEFLARTELFRGQTPGALAEIAEQMQRLELAAGETVFEQGDAGDRFYLVRSGAVEVLTRHDGRQDGGEKVLARLGEGDVFGETALLTREPRNATVRVVEPCELLALGQEDFRTALDRSKTLGEELRDILSLRS